MYFSHKSIKGIFGVSGVSGVTVLGADCGLYLARVGSNLSKAMSDSMSLALA